MAYTAPSATLQAIMTKTRRLTRSPSPAIITDQKLVDYINTFILYGFPDEIRLFSLKETLTFYTQPNKDTYDTNTTVSTDPLYNFKNRYISVHPPVYIGGVQAFYTQKRNLFYGYYPVTSPARDTSKRGDGVSGGSYSGTLPNKILQESVMFSAQKADNNGASTLVDYPQSQTIGYLDIPGKAAAVVDGTYGQINYLTGVYTDVAFPVALASDAVVYATINAYTPGRPVSMLYFNDTFILRPVPDKAYPIEVEVDVRPSALLEDGALPELEDYWQYIAYGASKLIFEDRMDTDSVQRIMPQFKEEERQLLRRTLTQVANGRTETIYSVGKAYGSNFLWPRWPY